MIGYLPPVGIWLIGEWSTAFRRNAVWFIPQLLNANEQREAIGAIVKKVNLTSSSYSIAHSGTGTCGTGEIMGICLLCALFYNKAFEVIMCSKRSFAAGDLGFDLPDFVQ